VEPADFRHASDESIAAAAQQGDARALEVLLERHEGKVLRVLGFLGVPVRDREDVAQEVFIRVFRHLGTFRRGLPFGGWLYRVSVNAALDHRRRRDREARTEAAWVEERGRVGPGRDPAEILRSRDLRAALLAALDRLSERERAVFVLREVEGLDGPEVARALGITQVTVRRHLGRARRSLRRILSLEEAAAIGVERIAPGPGSHG
jgi:RNA polymerase sigma-70 factor (ECF subfamily)